MDFRRLVPHGGSTTAAFEEFCCQLARRDPNVPEKSIFQRNGIGSDLGVECLWRLPTGEKWGWQAKYVFDMDGLKKQVDKSLESAVANHPELTQYTVCLPFVPSAATGTEKGKRRSKSQVDKLNAYVTKWIAFAATKGLKLAIEVWTASDLQDRFLEIDAHGGRRRYWFDDNLLTDQWFREHTEQAIVAAGPRYTPSLHVGHALDSAIGTLCRSAAFDDQVRHWLEKLEACIEELRLSLRKVHPDPSVPAYPDAHADTAHSLAESLDSLRTSLGKALAPMSHKWHETRALAATNRTHATALEASLSEDLNARYGEHASESKNFRSYHAEYQVSFPASHLDRARRIVSIIDDLSTWLTSPALEASLTGTLLVTGPPGIGKTHSMCDASQRRLKSALYSILLFGGRFSDGAAWEQMRAQLGLSGDWSLDALLDALDAAGETSGRPLLITIDALNERRPRDLWQLELAPLAHAMRKRENLRLCLTCRTGYTEQVLPRGLDAPIFTHPGFSGIEFDACRSFFSAYELDPPIGPILDPEFRNPLFLKIVCEAVKVSGLKALPSGWIGFREALAALLDARTKDFEKMHGPTARGVLSRGLEAIATSMASGHVRSLPLTDAIATISERVRFDARLILDQLLGDELLMLIPGSGSPGLLTAPEDHVSFAFERLGDQVVAQAMLATVPDGAPLPAAMLSEVANDPGLAEAFSVQLPERSGVELLDACDVTQRHAVFGPWLRALPWRNAETLRARAEHWIEDALNRRTTNHAALDALLTLAARPSRLDASWLHRRLARLSMALRDSVWCPYLHFRWDVSEGGPSPVRRLIDVAWEPGAEALPPEVLRLWLTAVCWFFASADRRVRDEATRAAVLLTCSTPSLWKDVLPHFLTLNDDYIVERVLASAYGALLRRPDPAALRDVTGVIAPLIFGKRTHANAQVRDLARCIGDLAIHHQAIESTNASPFRPPYRSEWPLKVPAEGSLQSFDSNEFDEQYPRLYSSTNTESGDFFNYTIPHAIEPYTRTLSVEAAGRWIFQTVLDIGYAPDRFANFDRYMMSKYGAMRDRLGWAERVGKKYQRIALGRLVATLSDHVPVTPEDDLDIEHSGLAAQRLRDIDPGVLVQANEAQSARRVDDLTTEEPADDEAWVTNWKDVLQRELALWNIEFDGHQNWMPLEAHCQWIDRRERKGDLGFRRQIWIQLRSYFVARDRFTLVSKWLRRKDFNGRWMPEGYEIYGHVFVGEYPWGEALKRWDLVSPDTESRHGNDTPPVPLLPTTHSLNAEFTEDYSRVNRKGLLVATPTLLEGLHWDGAGGFCSADEKPLVVDPSFTQGGDSICLVNRAHLAEYLDRCNMSLVWTVLSERLPGNYVETERLNYSHARGLHEGVLADLAKPVVSRPMNKPSRASRRPSVGRPESVPTAIPTTCNSSAPDDDLDLSTSSLEELERLEAELTAQLRELDEESSAGPAGAPPPDLTDSTVLAPDRNNGIDPGSRQPSAALSSSPGAAALAVTETAHTHPPAVSSGEKEPK